MDSKNHTPSGFGTTDVLVNPKKRSKNSKKAMQRRQGNLPLEPTGDFEPPLLEFLKLHQETKYQTQENQNTLKKNAQIKVEEYKDSFKTKETKESIDL